jgi:uncharacterized protein YdbL (DUF1318 family)
MMKKSKLSCLRSLVMCAGLLFASSAFAMELDEAKSRGLVGERADGYLGVVIEDPPAEVLRLVDDVNAKRRSSYESIAVRNKITLADVEARAGHKAIEMTPSGGWVFRVRWEKK